MSGHTRERQFTAGSCGKHYTLTLDDAAVHCTSLLEAGWWEVLPEGDNAWLKTDTAVIAAITTADGDRATKVRDGGGALFFLETAGYIAAKRVGSTAVTIDVQRRG